MAKANWIQAAVLGALFGNLLTSGVAAQATSAIHAKCEMTFQVAPKGAGRSAAVRERKFEDWNNNISFGRLLLESEKFAQVRSVYDSKLETRVFYTATGLADANGRMPRIDPDSKGIVVFIHGSGTAQSSGANFTANMNRLANIGFTGMSLDLPFHADGPTRDQFKSADFFMRWIHEVLRPARESGKPVYLVGHSFGPDVIAEYLYRYPQDVSGASMLSPAAFNPVLNNWYDTHTVKMKFGDVADSTLGSLWAGQIAQGFKWQFSKGVGDPTLANPNLKLEVLTGNREEYVPAPVGGKRKLPIGTNTYSLPNAMQPFFARANITLEPGIGHYIFDHVDANGHNVVMRTIYSMMGLDVRLEAQMMKDHAAKLSARPYWVQLGQLTAGDPLFQSWLVSTKNEDFARGVIRTSNSVEAEKLIRSYGADYKARVKEIRY